MNTVSQVSVQPRDWLPSRKAVACVFALLAFVALSCAALYLSAVLFLVLNKADPRQASFTSITNYPKYGS